MAASAQEGAAVAPPSSMTNGKEWEAGSSRSRKVETIFNRFDKNTDGRLNREEMSALVIAVNPKVKFSDEQIQAILDEVFRTYGEYIDPEKGLSLDGLRRTYDDGAGDVDRDFEALGLKLDQKSGDAGANGVVSSAMVASAMAGGAGTPSSIADDLKLPSRATHQQSMSNVVLQGNEGPQFESTVKMLEDLDILLKRHQRSDPEMPATPLSPLSPDAAAAAGGHPLGGPEVVDQSGLARGLGELRKRADGQPTPEQAFDAHMAMGQTLMDNCRPDEALLSFWRAIELRKGDVRAHFRCGNALYLQGRFADARGAYEKGLEAGKQAPATYSALLPQVHVNLGIALEGEGMLMGACEHYREAAILNANHYRALKLLGSALYGLGEYEAAEEALRHALYLKPDYADAHCDLGSTLHAQAQALKDPAMEERAQRAFNQAIELKPSHVDGLYNLGGLLRDIGKFDEAADMYSRVLSLRPHHWRAQLNRAVALLGASRSEEAKKVLREAFKMTNRIELYDAIKHLKRLSRKNKGLSAVLAEMPDDAGPAGRDGELGGGQAPAIMICEPHRFKRANQKTTSRLELSVGLEVRAFQRHTRLGRVEVSALRREFTGPTSPALGTPDRTARKSAIERALRNLLRTLTAETFQGAVRDINVRIMEALDQRSRGAIDVGLLGAVMAPLCAGNPDERRRTAFDLLAWRMGDGKSEVARADVLNYLSLLRRVYLGPIDPVPTPGPEEPRATVSFREFVEMFADPQVGFTIMDLLLKLEMYDHVRHGSLTCSVCSYSIMGLRFREVHTHFNLCSMCYADGKVPASSKRDEYIFKEFSSEASGSFDRLNIFKGRQAAGSTPPPNSTNGVAAA